MWKMLSIRSFFKRKPKDEGIRYVHLEETDSTNQYCLDHLRHETAVEGKPVRMAVVSADYQTSGRGQGGNSWESGRGENLLCSILCHPVWVPVTSQFVLSECAALAIRDALADRVADIAVKWPNDIYWRDRKLCGVLIENRLSGGHITDCVVGIGLNVNQREFHSDAPNPVSLFQITGRETDRQQLLTDIVTRFDHYLKMVENGGYGDVVTAYASHLYRQSGFYRYRDGDGEFEAALVEVEDDGHLVLRDREGMIRSYAFKEVEFIIST